MKKRTCILFLLLIAALLLSACGSRMPSGTYVCQASSNRIAKLTFKGSNVYFTSINTFWETEETGNGTFRCDGKQIVITWDNKSSETYQYNDKLDTILIETILGTLTFAKQ